MTLRRVYWVYLSKVQGTMITNRLHLSGLTRLFGLLLCSIVVTGCNKEVWNRKTRAQIQEAMKLHFDNEFGSAAKSIAKYDSSRASVYFDDMKVAELFYVACENIANHVFNNTGEMTMFPGHDSQGQQKKYDLGRGRESGYLLQEVEPRASKDSPSLRHSVKTQRCRNILSPKLDSLRVSRPSLSSLLPQGSNRRGALEAIR